MRLFRTLYYRRKKRMRYKLFIFIFRLKMPLTRAQINGTQPIVKVQTKFRKYARKFVEPIIDNESDGESVIEPLPCISPEPEPDPIENDIQLYLDESDCKPMIELLTENLPCVSPEPDCEPVIELLTEPQVFKHPIKKILKMKAKSNTPPDWKVIKHTKNSLKLDRYMFKKDEAFKQNNKATCQICNTKDHIMRAKYTDLCSCGYAFCMRRHRAYICCSEVNADPKKQKVKLYVKGQCLNKDIATYRMKKDRRTIDRGFFPTVKKIIQRMIKENIDLTPKVCQQMLINGKEVSTEQVEKKCPLPFLGQVSYY